VQPHCTKARASVCTTLLSMVPPNSGCGCAITAMPHALPSGTLRSSWMRPAGPASSSRSVCAFIPASSLPSSAQVRRRQQALHHLAVLHVLLDDLVDVVLVDVRVPDAFRVHHGNRAALAAVHATGLVHAH